MSVAREKGAGQIMALLRTTRPLSSLVAGTMSASVVIAAQGRLSLGGFAAGLAMTALTMFGFVVNDVVDFNKDAGAGVHRPIARGELSRSRAMLFAAALLLSVYLVSPAGGWGDRILAVTSVALVVYSPLAQRFPLGKGAYVAVLCCAPLWYGSVTSGVPRSWISYATLACFVLGREALMDSDEQVGDRRAGLKTIATILGCRQTRRIGAIAMLLPAVFLAGVVRGSLGRIMALAALVSLTSVFLWPGLSDGRRIHLSRFPMLIGAVAIACGAK
jgi:geranylgeranylglycerol-phosphate geranylgeranyltransferase